jgi:hypothetical protein
MIRKVQEEGRSKVITDREVRIYGQLSFTRPDASLKNKSNENLDEDGLLKLYSLPCLEQSNTCLS